MIIDSIMGALFNMVHSFINLFPDMPDRPEAIGYFWQTLGGLNLLIPAQEIYQFLPTILGAYVALGVYRIIRFFLPGG